MSAIIISLSGKMIQLFKDALLSPNISDRERDLIERAVDIARADVASVKLVATLLQSNGAIRPMAEALKGSRLTFPSFEKGKAEVDTKQATAMQQRREYLLLRQQDREYNQMVHGQDSHPDINDDNNLSKQFSSMKGQFTISANMLVSVFVMYGIGYMIGRSMTENETSRMICGLVCSIGIMIVEMMLFIVRAVQVERVYENKKPLNASEQAAYRPKLAVQSTDSKMDPTIPLLNLMDDDDDDTWEDSSILSKDSLSKKTD